MFEDRKACEAYRKSRSSYITTRVNGEGQEETIMSTYPASCIKSEPTVRIIKKGRVEIRK